ncbi:MAG TPA: hypothetical protein VFE51_28315 [Verrucomicrobiae bacterium]|nr:hypothetical protein [Verrucomicrobiae bacterium]
MKRKHIQIDRDKLHAAVRKLGDEYVFYMLDDAIELLSPAKLYQLAKKYIDLKRLQPDAEQAAKPGLLTDVKRFEKASLAGEYYESFDVNSKNCMEKSAGTCAWIAEHDRLLNRCVSSAKGSEPAEVRQAIDILFGLLDHIDECLDDVIFFAERAARGRSAWTGRRCCQFGLRSSRPRRNRRNMPRGLRPSFPVTTAMAATRCLRSLDEWQTRTNAQPSKGS